MKHDILAFLLISSCVLCGVGGFLSRYSVKQDKPPEALNETNSTTTSTQNTKAESTDLGTKKQKRKTKIGAKNVYESDLKSNKAGNHQVWQNGLTA